MITDYLSDGNRSNVFGNSNGDITPGVSGTQPSFYVEGQLVKIPYYTGVTAGSWDDSATGSATRPEDYMIAKIKGVTKISDTGVNLETEIVRKG